MKFGDWVANDACYLSWSSIFKWRRSGYSR